MDHGNLSELPTVIATCIQKLNKKDDWEVREHALLELQSLCDQSSEDSQETIHMLAQKEVMKALNKPLQVQVRDLRSALVREACKFISQFAMALKDHGNLLYHLILPTLAKVRTSGNKVIAGYIDSCCVDILLFGHPRNAVSVFTEGIIGMSKSKEVREYSLECLQIVLNRWHHHYLERDADDIEKTILLGLGDASPDARSRARHCYWSLNGHFPDRARRVYLQLDTRTRNLIDNMSAEAKNPLVEAPSPRKHQSPRNQSQSNGNGFSNPLDSSSSFRQDANTMQENITSRRAPVLHSVDLMDQTAPHQSRSSSTHSVPVEQQSVSPNGIQRRRQTHPAPNNDNASLPQIGSMVLVEGASLETPHVGHVRFVGSTSFASGIWVGVELELPRGKNNGSVRGVEYFTCKPHYGIFVRPEMVSRFTGLHGPPPNGHLSVSPSMEVQPPPPVLREEKLTKLLILMEKHRKNLESSLASIKHENEILAELERGTRNDNEIELYVARLENALHSREEGLANMWASLDEFNY